MTGSSNKLILRKVKAENRARNTFAKKIGLTLYFCANSQLQKTVSSNQQILPVFQDTL